MKVLVSIIIPSYNYGHLILETLESVVAQTYTNWECIIVNDGSKDNTIEIVEDFIYHHPGLNIQLITTANAGTAAAKNTGLLAAKGSMVQFLDADDLLSHNKVACHVKLLENSKAALVYSQSKFFTCKAATKVYVNNYPEGFLSKQSWSGHELISRIIRNNFITIAAPLVHTHLLKAVGGFNEGINNNEDWLLWFKVAMINPFFQYDGCEDVFTAVRIHNASAMKNQQQMFLGEQRVREIMDQELSLKDDLNFQYVKQTNLELLALHQIRSLNVLEGMRYILTNFKKSPVKNFRLISKGLMKYMIRLIKN